MTPNPKELLEKAIALDPKHPEAHYKLGLLNKSEGKLEVALENFLQAVTLNPNFSEAE